MTHRIDWESAGLIQNGRAGRPVRAGVLKRPKACTIGLDTERPEEPLLRWECPRGSATLEYVQEPPSRDLLDEFVRLTDATDADIVEFAERRGVLGLCRCRLPHSHNSADKRAIEERHSSYCVPLYWERLTDWRFWARQFRASLNVAAAIQKEEIADLDDLNFLWQGRLPALPPRLPRRGSARHEELLLVFRCKLADHVSRLLSLARVLPELKSTGRTLSIVLVPSGEVNLFGHLTLQLMTAMARTEGLGLCSGCGESYVITGNRPNPNRRSYCPQCGRRAALRDAAREYRRRKRERKKGAD